jgi:hypothetical protein
VANAGAFYNDLAPYGAWLQQPDYGLVWQPTVDTINPNWCPYVDAGQWFYSDSGWYWQSDYTWGWAVFHYGRWVNIPRHGWVWQPGNIWSPAWVAWRANEPYIGWAPLPPGAGLNVLAQLTYKNQPIGPNATLGLPASAYTFVNLSNLTSRNLPRRAVPASRLSALVQSSVILDTYAIINNRIFNGGAKLEDVAAVRQKPVPQVALRAVTSQDAAGLALDRKTLAVYVPSAASATGQSAASASRPQETAEKLTSPDPAMLAEDDSTAASAVPAAYNGSDVPVQLPPLRYPPSKSQAGIRRHQGDNSVENTLDAALAKRDWTRGFSSSVEHPATTAPRFDGFNPPAHQAESPRFAVENHSGPVEQAHAAPAPAPAASAPSASSSKSGK